MTDALLSALEIENAAHTRTGYRLHQVEIYNWGTFDKSVWSIDPGGQTSLLTGDIGSGKSTLVDAITTLLLPAHRIAYNKAAGADIKERSLRSYVEGHYKSERNEVTGASRAVGLRDHRSYSVILGRFANAGYHEQVTIAQVFHQKDRAGQPDRFFVTASTALQIDPDFSDFGSDLKTLRAKLRSRGADIDNTFPEYHRRVRRLLGIRSEQAMDLFHQTVSMKSVGNLNDFVRDHMLEPVSADDRVRAIVDHFDNLVKAHEAVRTATDQLAVLTPLVEAADRFDQAATRHHDLTNARSAVVPYIAERLGDVLAREIAGTEGRVAEHERRKGELHVARAALVPERDRLTLERAGVGGDRLRALERDIPRARASLGERVDRFRTYSAHLASAELDPVDGEAAFRDRTVAVAALRASLEAQQIALRAQRMPLFAQGTDARRARDRAAAEIESLGSRANSLPEDLDRVRRQLCSDLDIAETDIPFVGELLTVGDNHSEWRGAAERVLRGFALSLLVPQQLYPAVSPWVNDNHLGARLVYLRVPERRVRAMPAQQSAAPQLRDVIEVEDGPFRDYLETELGQRADHVLAESVSQLQRESRAVTREGLIRDRDRHEKDDRRRASDPRGWVLGRGSDQKIAALEAERAEQDLLVRQVESAMSRLDAEDDSLGSRRDALAALGNYSTWTELDVDAAAAELSSLELEREQLVAGSSRLAAIDEQLNVLEADDRRLASESEQVISAIGGESASLTGLRARQKRESDVLAALGDNVITQARALYPALDARSRRDDLTTVDGCDDARRSLTDGLTVAIETAQHEMNGYITSIQKQMEEVLRRWNALRENMDADIGSIGEFRALHARVQRDDLPRFEKEFREQLNTNAVRELAQFNHWLRRQADEIRGRVDLVNEALGAIDYNPGHVIVLLPEPTVNQDVRQFRADLRDATADVLADDEINLEQRFAQIQALIARFQGRVGHADSDRQWTRRVTDVRNWFTFAASEQDRATGEEFEHYTDSDGKSGGQKEKLAYTILAASLAYQFGLEWGVEKSRDFRFAVIDEAFGRGSDASTRYALELFAKLGLQLLIVTPLQKVHVIEPYVRSIGFVDNPTGGASRVHTLTIEEFRERQSGRA